MPSPIVLEGVPFVLRGRVHLLCNATSRRDWTSSVLHDKGNLRYDVGNLWDQHSLKFAKE